MGANEFRFNIRNPILAFILAGICYLWMKGVIIKVILDIFPQLSTSSLVMIIVSIYTSIALILLQIPVYFFGFILLLFGIRLETLGTEAAYRLAFLFWFLIFYSYIILNYMSGKVSEDIHPRYKKPETAQRIAVEKESPKKLTKKPKEKEKFKPEEKIEMITSKKIK